MTNKSMQSFRDTIEAVAIALLLALFIRTFIVQAFKIPSGSMLETLQIGDHLLVSKFSYDVRLPANIFLETAGGKVLLQTGNPERGDIVVFKYPEDERKDFIKRVIGLPGETLEIRDTVVYIDGKPLDEPYTIHNYGSSARPGTFNFGPVVIPEGEYFMMGDNRGGSHDSRWWGTVKREKIVGKSLIIYWSWGSLTDIRFGRIGTIFRTPTYVE